MLSHLRMEEFNSRIVEHEYDAKDFTSAQVFAQAFVRLYNRLVIECKVDEDECDNIEWMVCRTVKHSLNRGINNFQRFFNNDDEKEEFFDKIIIRICDILSK